MNNLSELCETITNDLNNINPDTLYYDIIDTLLNDYTLQDMLYCSFVYNDKTIFKYASYTVAWKCFVQYNLNKHELPQKVKDTISTYLYFWVRENNSNIVNRIEKYCDMSRNSF